MVSRGGGGGGRGLVGRVLPKEKYPFCRMVATCKCLKYSLAI